jgi:hypothetical protein
LNLDDIVTQLNRRKQRATYGVVAGLVGGLARGLMQGRPKNNFYSWVVAQTSRGESRRGWPSGYSSIEVHPDCLSDIRNSPDSFIDDSDMLSAWLQAGRPN